MPMASDDQSTTKDVRVPCFGKCVMLLCSFISYGISMGIPSSLSVMFLDWQDTFQASRAYTSVVHSTCIGVLFGGAIIPGYVMNRFGARFTLMVGSLLATIGMVASIFATNIGYLIVFTGLIGGLGFSFLQIPIFPCVTLIFTKYKTLVISSCAISAALIGISSRYLFHYMINLHSWREAYTYIACVVLNTCVFGLIITSVVTPKPVEFVVTVDETNDEDIKQLNPNEPDEESYCQQTAPDGTGEKILQSDHFLTEDDNIFSTKEAESIPFKYELPSDIMFNNGMTKRSKNRVIRILQMSKWCFLADDIFILHLLHVAICTATIYSFALIQMDFARTLGFDRSTGVSFLTVVFASSIFGRFAVGLSDFFPNLSSITVHIIVSSPGILGMMLLSFIRDLLPVMCILSLVGLSVGGLVVIYPKCILDMKSVDRKSYPLALGLTCTVEGIMDILFPIFIGSSVDITGSYTFILLLMGVLSTLTSISLAVGFFYSKRKVHSRKKDRQREEHSDKEEKQESAP